MKPIWSDTLAWIAAIAIALLFALAGQETFDQFLPDGIAHGAEAPR